MPALASGILKLGIVGLLGIFLAGAMAAEAAEWFVATNGTAQGAGTMASPWDITSALAGRQRVAPGDTLWLRGGLYKYPGRTGSTGFEVRLAGRADAPVKVRAWQAERVTIDGGLAVVEPATHVWLWGLEILVSEPRPEHPVPPDPTYRNVNRPWGGLNVHSGSACKFINLVIHDNSQGISWWTGSRDSEVHGCLIYDNGWAGTDRGHGHAIYTQNREGVKRITDCIMTGGFGYTMHAYGSSRAYVDHYWVEGNVACAGGPFLIGGGRPSESIRVQTNFLHGVDLRLGYSAPTNHDCTVLGNMIVNGGLQINRFGQITERGNRVLPRQAPRPAGTEVVLRPNHYDPDRAHLLVFNWEQRPEVAVDLSEFLKTGDRYALHAPRAVFDVPVATGTFTGQPVPVRLAGEFAVFVVKRQTGRPAIR